MKSSSSLSSAYSSDSRISVFVTDHNHESTNDLQAMISSPPNSREIDDVLEKASSRLMAELGLFVPINPRALEVLSRRILSATSNPTEMIKLLEKLQSTNNRKVNDSNLRKWSYLKLKYACCQCKDVLAAPNVAPCDHSYCGSCILKTNGTLKKKFPCSECGVLVESVLFERHLAELVESLVSNAEECPEKIEWKKRSDRYMKLDGQIQESRDFNNISTNGNAFDFDDFVSEHFSAIVFSVLMMIVVLRRN